MLTTNDGIEPLYMYSFEIQPTSDLEGLRTEWTSTAVFISKFISMIQKQLTIFHCEGSSIM